MWGKVLSAIYQHTPVQMNWGVLIKRDDDAI